MGKWLFGGALLTVIGIGIVISRKAANIGDTNVAVESVMQADRIAAERKARELTAALKEERLKIEKRIKEEREQLEALGYFVFP